MHEELESRKTLGCSRWGGHDSVTGTVQQEDTMMVAGGDLVVQVLMSRFSDLGFYSVFSRRPLKFNMGELHFLNFGLNTDI